MSRRVEERFETTAWTLVKYGSGGNAALMPYSRRHVLRDDGLIFCGAKPGAHEGQNDSGRCVTCYRLAEKRIEGDRG
jgi:hypothetical protein